MKKILKKYKKVLIILGIFILLTVIILVVFKVINKNKKEVDYTTVILDKTTYKLTKNENEYDIHYKIASNFKKAKLPKYISYYSDGVDNSPYFLIKVYRYTDKNMNEAIENAVGNKYDKKKNIKINDLEYTVVKSKDLFKRDVKAYYHKHGDYIYAFYFNAKINISKLEKAFLHNVVYDENLDTDR